MKFLKNNILSLAVMTALFTVAMMGDASAESVFSAAGQKLINLFTNAKSIVFVIGGFGLIALAFQAIFGKIKWPWFAALAFGLAVVAAASSIITYAANDHDNGSGGGIYTRAGGNASSFEDTLGGGQGNDSM
ncbi:MAG: TrbC/VirB2 family protein [Alphaproteobacteria bacterium]|nr:TrbC/VirB2 family protein [Alphaproteobacteria bacterium]